MGSGEGFTMSYVIAVRSPIIVRVIKFVKFMICRSCSKNGRSFQNLTGKPTGNRPLGRPRRNWEDNIRMDLKEIDIVSRNLVDSAQGRDYCRALVNVGLNLQVQKPSSLDCC